ncbi:tetratricopeptide repeat protein [Streptomyces sp. NBC_01288]|uniref:tetratricopeptide repeat protein n=1 Tax=Streptomyces sp. NBC_01288 TaxID=2903814 RepID=UPI002E0D21CC|nr:tetratricopeptide repeat protein [Streptomyces sp. NBC_01288]
MLSADLTRAQAVAAVMNSRIPGSGSWYHGDHVDFDGVFMGDVIGSQVVHYHEAPMPTALGSLPPPTPSFTGRADLLNKLETFLRPPNGPTTHKTVTGTVLAGLAGVGKTALATQAAHEADGKGWFLGGILFIDLHGYDPTPVVPDRALLALLRALGTRSEHIPATEDERVNLYRARLAQWPDRVLLLADNASSPQQVRPLLPNDPRHRILITSRNAIPQLNAHHMPLAQLAPQAAVELLDQVLREADGSDDRISSNQPVAIELASLCGHLPLALQIAAALLICHPEKPVAESVEELRDHNTRLDFLDDGERSVRAAFDLSYRRLSDEQARLLRLLATAPGPEIGADALAALLGVEAPPLAALAPLERAYLVDRGGSSKRWRLHDLVRAFAMGVTAEDPSFLEECETARERVLDFYRQRADAADDHLRASPHAGLPTFFQGKDEALSWLDAERPGLLAAVQWGAEDRHARSAVDLALCLAEYLRWREYFEDATTVSGTARQVARRVGDLTGEAIACTNLGGALMEMGRVDEAADAFIRARDIYRTAANPTDEAMQWNNLAIARSYQGDHESALHAFNQALTIHEAMGNAVGHAQSWHNLGVTLLEADRGAEAINAFTRARELFRGADDPRGEALTLNNLDRALHSMSRFRPAGEAFSEATSAEEDREHQATGRQPPDQVSGTSG